MDKTGNKNAIRIDRITIATSAQCAECGKEFDLTNVVDLEEWYYGHDCE